MTPDVLGQAKREMGPRSEERLRDMILVALCAPMGRCRREYQYSTWQGYWLIEKLTDTYP